MRATKMKSLTFLTIFSILVTTQFSGGTATIFNAVQQPYLKQMGNLTTTAEMSEYFDIQSSIYVDNVYSVYQKFFYHLMGDLPKSLRTEELKQIIQAMDYLLNEQDFQRKMSLFDQFVSEFGPQFETAFEYDFAETLLNAEDFNELYLANGVEELLTYANNLELMNFVQQAGNGIKVFLLANRSLIDKERLMEFKAIIDKFLESETFVEKRSILKLFLKKCREYLQ